MDLLQRHVDGVEVEMKMRQLSARRAKASRRSRRIVEFRAMVQACDLQGAMNAVADAFVQSFVSAVTYGWRNRQEGFH